MPVSIWLYSDHKPGHENQSIGLVEALKKYVTVNLFQCAPEPVKILTSKTQQQLPQLIIGAGHKTHLSVLFSKIKYGGKSIILMKPSLPIRWFDYCVIPEHDQVPSKANIIPTKGVLNQIQASTQSDKNKALILMGGISNHYVWDNALLNQQISSIISQQQHIHFTLTTSRRTPSDFLATLSCFLNLSIVPHEQTDAAWLPKMLSQSAQIWVSPDSVSMVYEALTAGAEVGIFNLQKKQNSRVLRGVNQLLKEQYITNYDTWLQNEKQLTHPPTQLTEADRVAKIIWQTCLN